MQAEPETLSPCLLETPAPSDQDVFGKNRIEKGAAEIAGTDGGFPGSLHIAAGTGRKNPGEILGREGEDEIRVRLSALRVPDASPVPRGSPPELEVKVLLRLESGRAVDWAPEHAMEQRHAPIPACLSGMRLPTLLRRPLPHPVGLDLDAHPHLVPQHGARVEDVVPAD